MTAVLETVWAFANSALGIMAISALVAYGLARLFKARPVWKQYMGAITEAIKLAEKAIPDDTPSAGARRLDEALAWVLHIYHEAEGHMPTVAEVETLKDAIRWRHADLEAAGNLDKPDAPADE